MPAAEIALVISAIAVYAYSWVGRVCPKTFVQAVAGSSVLGVITVVAVVLDRPGLAIAGAVLHASFVTALLRSGPVTLAGVKRP